MRAKKNIYEALYEAERPPQLQQDFDRVISILASCHMPSLEPLYQHAAQALCPGGYVIVIDMHPHMFFIGKGTCVPMGEHGDRTIAIENTVHNFSDHINAAESAGLHLETLREQFVPPEWAQKSSNYSGTDNEPLSFGLVFSK